MGTDEIAQALTDSDAMKEGGEELAKTFIQKLIEAIKTAPMFAFLDGLIAFAFIYLSGQAASWVLYPPLKKLHSESENDRVESRDGVIQWLLILIGGISCFALGFYIMYCLLALDRKNLSPQDITWCVMCGGVAGIVISALAFILIGSVVKWLAKSLHSQRKEREEVEKLWAEMEQLKSKKQEQEAKKERLRQDYEESAQKWQDALTQFVQNADNMEQAIWRFHSLLLESADLRSTVTQQCENDTRSLVLQLGRLCEFKESAYTRVEAELKAKQVLESCEQEIEELQDRIGFCKYKLRCKGILEVNL